MIITRSITRTTVHVQSPPSHNKNPLEIILEGVNSVLKKDTFAPPSRVLALYNVKSLNQINLLATL
jgi:hypothetical protein